MIDSNASRRNDKSPAQNAVRPVSRLETTSN